MDNLLCQVCAKPAEREDGTLFIEWQHPEAPPLRLNRIRTCQPPLCPPCVRLSLQHCPHVRNEPTAVVLCARSSVVSGVSGTVYSLDPLFTKWIPSDRDVYSSYTKPRYPGMLAQRLYRKLRGVTVRDPNSLSAD
ncbi:hypothetical protein [Streptomyces sp. NPDC048623]|uniref:hypothetical protein n=1 Tax=Streptomyces sp. NPDC048623 TaxID=3155761 RepID=UPI00342E248C